MDMVLFFVDPNDSSMEKELLYISRLCDQNNIPFASNVATAEMLVLGMDRGDLDWRNIVSRRRLAERTAVSLDQTRLCLGRKLNSPVMKEDSQGT